VTASAKPWLKKRCKSSCSEVRDSCNWSLQRLQIRSARFPKHIQKIRLGTRFLDGLLNDDAGEEGNGPGFEVFFVIDGGDDLVGDADVEGLVESGVGYVFVTDGADIYAQFADTGKFQFLIVFGACFPRFVREFVLQADDVGLSLGVFHHVQFREMQPCLAEAQSAIGAGGGVDLEKHFGHVEEEAIAEAGRIVQPKISDAHRGGTQIDVEAADAGVEARLALDPVFSKFAKESILENEQCDTNEQQCSQDCCDPFKCLLHAGGGSLEFDVLGADFEALVLVFPNNRGVMIEKGGQELAAGIAEKLFGLFGGVFESFVVIARLFTLRVVPMGDGVDGTILFSPCLHWGLQFRGDFIKGYAGVATVLADESRFEDIPGEEGQEGGAAARGLDIRFGWGGKAFEPDLAIMGQLGGKPIGAEQGV
jgi:hypothetical protein